jgi:hypothetical protein
MNSLLLLPASAFSFLAGVALGRSRRGLSMLPPDRGSPLPGVPLSRWEKFVAVMVVRPKTYASPRRRLGLFGLDARRLCDVGFMTSPRKVTVGAETGVWSGEWVAPLDEQKFLASTPAQYEAFARSMRKMVPKVAPHVGKKIEGKVATLSGLLGAAHLAGEAGVEGWARDPGTRQKFTATTTNYHACCGIF